MARGRGSNGGDVVLFAMPGAQGGLLGIDASSLGGGGSNAGAPTGSRAQTGRPLSGERLRRRQAAQEELVTYFKQAAAAAERASAARPGSGGAASADGARGSDAAAVPRAADGETDGDSDTECPICLEPLSAGQVVCGPSCGHALHTSCLVNLIGFSSTSCPQCRASLVPVQLAHLAPALGGGSSRHGARQSGLASAHAPASAMPGVEPRSGGRLTAADWEWGASDDSDGDGDDAERGQVGGVRGRRSSDDSALSSDAGGGGSLVMALRLRAQHVSVLRAICAKVSLAVFLTLVGLVMFLLIGSFTRPSSHSGTR